MVDIFIRNAPPGEANKAAHARPVIVWAADQASYVKLLVNRRKRGRREAAQNLGTILLQSPSIGDGIRTVTVATTRV